MSNNCGICRNSLQFSSTRWTTPRGEVYHQQCLKQWLDSTLIVRANPMRPTYPRFATGDAENVQNLTSRIVNLQHTLETKDAEIATLTERISAQDERFQELTDRCSALERSKRKVEVALEKQANEIEMRRHQDKFIEELTGRCLALEISKRKLESELEKRVEENTNLQKPIAEKEKAKRTPRKALAALNSNTDAEAAPQQKRYFLRPR